MNHAEIVREIAGRIDLPTGRETVYFPKGKDLPEANRDHKGRGFVAGLDKYQQVFLGQLISVKAGKRYTLLPLQTSYDLVHKDKEFKKMAVDYWFHNIENILEIGEIMPSPIAVEKDEKLAFEGKTVKADIDVGSVTKTLASTKPKLFEKPKHKVRDWGITYENGISSVGSGWGAVGGCFAAYAGRPSGRLDRGVVALRKTGEKVEKPVMREVAESEYQEFIRIKKEHEALLKELEPVKKYF